MTAGMRKFYAALVGAVLGMVAGFVLWGASGYSTFMSALVFAFGGLLLGAAIGFGCMVFVFSDFLWRANRRQRIGQLFAVGGLIIGLAIGHRWMKEFTWDGWSMWLIAVVFMISFMSYGLLITREHAKRYPEKMPRVSFPNRKRIYVSDELLERCLTSLTQDKEADDNPDKFKRSGTESQIRFASRMHWTVCVQKCFLAGLVVIVALWLAAGRPGSDWIVAKMRANADTALLVIGAIILFTIGWVLYRRIFRKAKARVPYAFFIGGIILLWVAIGTPGADTLSQAVNEESPWRFWLYVVLIGGFWGYWQACDWIYTVILITNRCIRVIKRGPLGLAFMPNKNAYVEITEVGTARPVETKRGRYLHRAEVNADTASAEDYDFNRLGPLPIGPHDECCEEINLVKGRLTLVA